MLVAGDGKVSFLEQWNGIGWFTGAEEHDPLHLHCFAVGWVLGDGTLEGCGRELDFSLLVESHTAEPFDARGLRLLLG